MSSKQPQEQLVRPGELARPFVTVRDRVGGRRRRVQQHGIGPDPLSASPSVYLQNGPAAGRRAVEPRRAEVVAPQDGCEADGDAEELAATRVIDPVHRALVAVGREAGVAVEVQASRRFRLRHQSWHRRQMPVVAVAVDRLRTGVAGHADEDGKGEAEAGTAHVDSREQRRVVEGGGQGGGSAPY